MIVFIILLLMTFTSVTAAQTDALEEKKPLMRESTQTLSTSNSFWEPRPWTSSALGVLSASCFTAFWITIKVRWDKLSADEQASYENNFNTYIVSQIKTFAVNNPVTYLKVGFLASLVAILPANIAAPQWLKKLTHHKKA